MIAIVDRNSPAGKTTADSAETCRVCEASIPLERRASMPGIQICADCDSELDLAIACVGD